MPHQEARSDFPDFGKQIDKANKLDQVDPSVAELIVRSGLEDGSRGDDVVQVSRGTWPASALKPSQTSMVLGKALGMALLMVKTGKAGGDLGALVSKDKHILDGHHRWAATILASGSKGKVGGYGASLPGKDLLKVLNVISKGKFGVRGGKAGKGSLAQFTEGNVRSMLEDFAENGLGGPFPWSAESVQETLEKGFGSVEEGIDQISKNAKLITTSVPGWAPDRKQMPVIEPNQVPSAAKALTQGEVDWNDPFRREGALDSEDRTQLVRLASTLPQGSEMRRSILVGLKKASGQEAEKLDAKAEAEEDQADADRAKADAARMAMLRKASTLPKGSKERREILASLKTGNAARAKKVLTRLNDVSVEVDMLTRTQDLSAATKKKIEKLMKAAFDAIEGVSTDLKFTIDM